MRRDLEESLRGSAFAVVNVRLDFGSEAVPPLVYAGRYVHGGPMLEFAQFRLDTVNQCLWRRRDSGDDERILLRPKSFAVLRYLVEHAERLVTQDELIEAVWPDTHVQPQAVKKHILEIRTTLGDGPKKPLFIETLHRRGYRFVAAVSEGGSADPAFSARPAQVRLVGRGRALGELHDCLGRTLKNERQIVFVTGEPGIGKTALVDEFQREVTAEVLGIRIARGQCIEGYGGKEAYYPMLEALGQLCRSPGGDSVIQCLAAQAPTWLIQFPALLSHEQREMLQREIVGATRERMLREIGEALEAIPSGNPLVLIFEDLFPPPSHCAPGGMSAPSRWDPLPALRICACALPRGFLSPSGGGTKGKAPPAYRRALGGAVLGASRRSGARAGSSFRRRLGLASGDEVPPTGRRNCRPPLRTSGNHSSPAACSRLAGQPARGGARGKRN